MAKGGGLGDKKKRKLLSEGKRKPVPLGDRKIQNRSPHAGPENRDWPPSLEKKKPLDRPRDGKSKRNRKKLQNPEWEGSISDQAGETTGALPVAREGGKNEKNKLQMRTPLTEASGTTLEGAKEPEKKKGVAPERYKYKNHKRKPKLQRDRREIRVNRSRSGSRGGGGA